MAVVWVVGPRLVTAQANVRRSLDDEPGISVGAFEGIVPGGTVGWRIKPKMREALLLPIVIGVVALISITPFLNPQRRSIALIGDAVLVVAICIRWAVTARNTRVLADRSLGRACRWRRDHDTPRSPLRHRQVDHLRRPHFMEVDDETSLLSVIVPDSRNLSKLD